MYCRYRSQVCDRRSERGIWDLSCTVAGARQAYMRASITTDLQGFLHITMVYISQKKETKDWKLPVKLLFWGLWIREIRRARSIWKATATQTTTLHNCGKQKSISDHTYCIKPSVAASEFGANLSQIISNVFKSAHRRLIQCGLQRLEAI